MTIMETGVQQREQQRRESRAQGDIQVNLQEEEDNMEVLVRKISPHRIKESREQ